MSKTADYSPSSALALNCCQFAYSTQKSSSRSRGDSNKNNDWMSKLHANKKLRDIVMPGTHNSASSTISKWSLFSGVAICQNLSIYHQLNEGARYLDLRVCSHQNEIITCHGIVKGNKLSQIVDEVDDFLNDNPTEFVIVEINNEAPITSSQKQRLLTLIRSTFGERMISYTDTMSWFKLNQVTLGDVHKNKKNILILINGSFAFQRDDGVLYEMKMIAREFACFHNETLLQNKWHNTANPTDLLQRNLTHLRSLSISDRDYMVCNQFVFTPQPPRNVLDVVCLLFGLKTLQPISLVKQLYQEDNMLQHFVANRRDLHWNIISLDFIDLCQSFVNFLIETNSSRQNT